MKVELTMNDRNMFIDLQAETVFELATINIMAPNTGRAIVSQEGQNTLRIRVSRDKFEEPL